MKEKIGDWLLDVAKYLITAVIIYSIFGNIESQTTIFIAGGVATVITFVTGLFLIKNKE